jgi:hypothetical protein
MPKKFPPEFKRDMGAVARRGSMISHNRSQLNVQQTRLALHSEGGL